MKIEYVQRMTGIKGPQLIFTEFGDERNNIRSAIDKISSNEFWYNDDTKDRIIIEFVISDQIKIAEYCDTIKDFVGVIDGNYTVTSISVENLYEDKDGTRYFCHRDGELLRIPDLNLCYPDFPLREIDDNYFAEYVIPMFWMLDKTTHEFCMSNRNIDHKNRVDFYKLAYKTHNIRLSLSSKLYNLLKQLKG